MKTVIYGLTLGVFAVCITFVRAEDRKKSCKTIIGELTNKQLKEMGNCTKELKFKNGKEKQQKSTCVLKCVMSKVNVLSKEYKADPKTLDDFVNAEFTDKDLQDRARPLFQNCVETVGKTLDPSEEFCKSYDPYIKCLTVAIYSVCPA